MLQEIGISPNPMHKSAFSKTLENESRSEQPIPRRPINKFTTLEPKQSILNSRWKQEKTNEVCGKIDRFM